MTTRTWAPTWGKGKGQIGGAGGASVSPIQPPSSMRTGKPVKRMIRAACLKDSGCLFDGIFRKGREKAPASHVLLHDRIQLVIEIHFLILHGKFAETQDPALKGNKKNPRIPLRFMALILRREHPGRSPFK